MSWRRARFKDADVWVEVDAKGAPIVRGGRTPIRYSPDAGAKVYRAGASRVEMDPAAPEEDLAPGVDADAVPRRASAGSGFGSAGTRTAGQAAMAHEAARALLEGLSVDTVRAFTDGACRGNPGPAGSGAVLVLPDGRRAEASRALGHATNNVGELTAIGLALDLLEEAGVEGSASVALFTDSSYANGVLTRGWKAKANRDLVEGLRERLARWPHLTVYWLAGHVGIPDNERADALANAGVEGVTRIEWT